MLKTVCKCFIFKLLFLQTLCLTFSCKHVFYHPMHLALGDFEDVHNYDGAEVEPEPIKVAEGNQLFVFVSLNF